MKESDSLRGQPAATNRLSSARLEYERQVQTIRERFETHAEHPTAGKEAVAARSAAVDHLVQSIWTELSQPVVMSGASLVLTAIGGYGRGELFPHSDVDLLLLLDSEGVATAAPRSVTESIRQLHQSLWDCGLRASVTTRSLAECEQFDPANVESSLALLDARYVSGDGRLFARLTETVLPHLVVRDGRKIAARLLELTRARHSRYGETLFHLEPNVKECRGGLRDAHVCGWLARLGESSLEAGPSVPSAEFTEARQFLLLVRTYLHFRHNRDDNTLDWQAQDAAAQIALGVGSDGRLRASDAAWWMRHYFRNARAIERRIVQFLDQATSPLASAGTRTAAKRSPAVHAQKSSQHGPPQSPQQGFELRQNRIALTTGLDDPAEDPEVVFAVFTTMSSAGARLTAETEARIESALPLLSANLEDGPGLWRHLQQILLGSFAGRALRSMHALGILELLIPEFHGIDALVIRDAYHRYTVDEHTFVLIDTLQRLATDAATSPELAPWASRFAGLYRDLPHPELLLLASLLHDTGKGHAAQEHSAESARMAANLLSRLELDPYETGLVLDLIRNHLEMSAALRRDLFDRETIRAFAAHVPHPEALRMLALFTYADIAAVHPDALTPWKAENLWRLYQATAHFLDRNVDDQRVSAETDSANREGRLRLHARRPGRRAEIVAFLEGFPSRYLQTRTPEAIALHVEMAAELARQDIQLSLRWLPGSSELTLVTADRPRLFSTVAGALAGWGMNIVTADAFSNATAVVVDTFRFTDTFRTLELNESERERFLASLRDLITGKTELEALLQSRRRARRKSPKLRVETRIDFDQFASSQRTLLDIVAQDTPGLLRAVSLTLAEHACNIEVALIDTEGEMAIDVFYITRLGSKLDAAQKASLQDALLEGIERNAR